jgi:hypothetical protein
MTYYRVPVATEYKYKCPCGGEFIDPIYKDIVEEINNINHNCAYTTTRNAAVCPFCNKEMKGL